MSDRLRFIFYLRVIFVQTQTFVGIVNYRLLLYYIRSLDFLSRRTVRYRDTRFAVHRLLHTSTIFRLTLGCVVFYTALFFNSVKVSRRPDERLSSGLFLCGFFFSRSNK